MLQICLCNVVIGQTQEIAVFEIVQRKLKGFCRRSGKKFTAAAVLDL
jgi:hypothetical protein